MHLIIANKLYSSWSLRAWMLLKAFDIEFEETLIAMYKPDTKDQMLKYGPTGKVPVLVDGEATVWESLAIVGHITERFPDKNIFPADPVARPHARSTCNEMHAGFTGLRSQCPMNLTARFEYKFRGKEVEADVNRLEAMWADARSRFGQGGPFMYGEFSCADAMYAPVVTRLDTYQIPVSDQAREYMDAVLNHPAFLAWKEEAFKEPWFVDHYEEGETVSERFYLPEEASA